MRHAVAAADDVPERCDIGVGTLFMRGDRGERRVASRAARGGAPIP
ncbi:MAG: hypothetical protein ABI229_04935 [Gemmatimonadaceae bacterium]